MHRIRHSLGSADELGGIRACSEIDKKTLGRRPRMGARLLWVHCPNVSPHMVCHAAHGKLSQRNQIGFAKDFIRIMNHPLGHMHFAFSNTLKQLVRREVHKRNLTSLIEESVRNSLAGQNAGDLRH